MELTKEEREAIEKSIKHWERDVIKKFDEGLFINHTSKGIIWTDGKKARISGNNCPLCRMFPRCYMNNRKSSCPYIRFYGHPCDFVTDKDQYVGHWVIFVEEPTRENAIAMIDSLKKILTDN